MTHVIVYILPSQRLSSKIGFDNFPLQSNLSYLGTLELGGARISYSRPHPHNFCKISIKIIAARLREVPR